MNNINRPKPPPDISEDEWNAGLLIGSLNSTGSKQRDMCKFLGTVIKEDLYNYVVGYTREYMYPSS